MKDYLNKNERVQMLFLKKYIDNIEHMLETNNLTKDEIKALKMAKTWGVKAFNNKVDRLNPTALKTFSNSLGESYLKVNDKYAMDMYQRKLSSKIEDSFKENKDYFRLVELLMHYNCRNCKKRCTSCEIYTEFEEHCIPEPTGDELGNCRYAYKERDCYGQAIS